MAFYETRTIQVANNPSEIDRINEQMAGYFWEVKSQQVTDRKDSHTEHSSDGYYVYETVVTDSANYCTITYQRDKTMPHYSEFVNLENTLNTIRGIQNESVEVGFNIYNYRWILLLLVWPLGLYLILTYNSKRKVQEEREYSELQKSKEERLAKYPTESEVLEQIDTLRTQIYKEMREGR